MMSNNKHTRSSDMTIEKWYEQFQVLINLWKENFSAHTWLESHKKELTQLGLDSSKLSGNIQHDIALLAKQIADYN